MIVKDHALTVLCAVLECGRTTPRLEPMVIGGATAKLGELPWHVGIYRRTSSPYRLICGGSIVSRNIVVSAAHCFWDLHFNVQYPASNFGVAAGKVYRPWREMEQSAQYSFVEEIVIPDIFRGADRNFADDIALAVLSRPFQFKPYLRPVCLDFNRALEKEQLQNGNLGKIAGWGFVTTSGSESALLKTVELPYMDIKLCLRSTPTNYWEVLSNDKFCAGRTNGSTALCQGDSGGGLVFPKTDSQGVMRYYLRGVVSTSPSSNTKCNSFAVTSFTRVSRYESLIQRKVFGEPARTDPACVLPPFPENGRYTVVGASADAGPGISVKAAILRVECDKDYSMSGPSTLHCVDGVWESAMPICYDCGRTAPDMLVLIVNGTRAQKGGVPWHVGVYSKAWQPLELLCGGTIITANVVVTAAHCLSRDPEGVRPASEFAVAAGKLYRSWSSNEPDVQYSNVSEIGVPRRYLGRITNFAEDIAVLTLTTSLLFKSYLRPVCLDRTNALEDKPLRSGSVGMIAGWGLTDPDDGKQSDTLMTTRLSYKDVKTCTQETPESFQSYYTADKFCAGTNGTALCRGDSGAGLTFPETDSSGVLRFYLRGVASTAPSSDSFCNVYTNTYFTKVSRHLSLIDRYTRT